MCGRFDLHGSLKLIEKRFDGKLYGDDSFRESFNIAPSQKIYSILNIAPEEIVPVSWGYIPHWVKNPTEARAMINARAETAPDKPYFRDSYKKRRCLILATGFYEWDRKGSKKVPYYIHMKDGEPFAFAGIWDEVLETDGKKYSTAAILTTAPNKLLKKIHNRMPVILDRREEKLWLEEGNDIDIETPHSPDQMEMYPVSTKVNKPSYNTPAVINPVSSKATMMH